MPDLINKTSALLLNSSLHMQCLRAARTANLPDWFIGAGFLRNLIWDHLHQKSQLTPLNDVDLVYFDNQNISPAFEEEMSGEMQSLCPEVKWEIKNQARMHLRHNHSPYRNTTEGISYWVEVPTSVGVRLTEDNQFEFTAPFGLEENWSLDVRVNPNNPKYALFRERVKSKGWQRLWPKLNCLL